MFAKVDCPQWNTQRAAEPPLSPELQHMFALARRMGYEMRPIARRSDAPRRTPGPQTSPGQGYCASFRPGRNYSKIKCFSCGQMGHTQARCPKPNSTHRETKYRPGPDPHWPTRHRLGPRFIITVISDLHSEYSSASTYRGGSTTTSTTGHSVQLASPEADILTSASAGDPVHQFPVPDREEWGKWNLCRWFNCRSRRPQSRIQCSVMIP